jgi:hypothetical protein
MTKRKLAINKKAKKEIEKYPLVEIKWYDITSDSSWASIEDCLNLKLPICTTKGHLLTQSKGITRVFGDYALKDEKTGQIDEIANTTIIPNSVIIEIKKI